MDNMNLKMPEQEPEKVIPEEQPKTLEKFEEKNVSEGIKLSEIKDKIGNYTRKMGVANPIGNDDNYKNNRNIESVVRNAYDVVRRIMMSSMYKEKRIFIFKDNSYKKDIKKLISLINVLERKMQFNSKEVDKTVESIDRVVERIQGKYQLPPDEKNQIAFLDSYIKDTMLCLRKTQEIKGKIDKDIYAEAMDILYQMRVQLNTVICDGFSVKAEDCYVKVVEEIADLREKAINDLYCDNSGIEKALSVIENDWAKLDSIPRGKNKIDEPTPIVMNDAISYAKDYASVERLVSRFFNNVNEFMAKYEKLSEPTEKKINEKEEEKQRIIQQLDELDENAIDGLISVDQHIRESRKLKDRMYYIEDEIMDLEDTLDADEMEIEDMRDMMRPIEEMQRCKDRSSHLGLITEIVAMFKESEDINYAEIITLLQSVTTLSEEQSTIISMKIKALIDSYRQKSERISQVSDKFRKMMDDLNRETVRSNQRHAESRHQYNLKKAERRIERQKLKEEARKIREAEREEYERAMAELRGEGSLNNVGEKNEERDRTYLENLNKKRNEKSMMGGAQSDPLLGQKPGLAKKRISNSGNVGDEN